MPVIIPNVNLDEDSILDEAKHLAGNLSKELVAVDTECLIDVSDDFISNFLKESEQAFYNGLKIPKKRTEWLAGRIAAKLALSHTLKLPLTSFEIVKDENRSPHVLINNSQTDVSISHSNGIALAIAGDHTIDIEVISSREKSFVEEAFSKEEIEALKIDIKDAEHITKLWTVKEAHLKRMRIGLKTDLHNVKITFNKDKTFKVVSEQGTSNVRASSSSKWAVSLAT